MSINILHISDLHFGTNSQKDKESTRYCEDFVSSFISQFDDTKIDYLIVSGDIANKSATMEYKKAQEFLNKVVKDLKISKDKVVICMGNHDISWDELVKIEDKGTREDELYKERSKYKNFKKFYNDFYKDGGKQIRQFNTDPVFVEIQDDSHKILFLGVNTCFHESNKAEDHYGYIDQTNFEKYLNSMKKQYNDYVKFLVMHHNPMDLCREQNRVKNWSEINHSKLGYPFVVFCGHIHGSDTAKVEKETDNSIYYISVGSLLQKSTLGKYNLYTISDDSSNLQIKYFNYHDDVNSSNQYWQEQTASPSSKEILLKQKVQKIDDYDRAMSRYEGETIQHLENQRKQARIDTDAAKPAKSILEVIKDHQLYYSGHFHWNTVKKDGDCKFKSHGYIDINYLVSHIESLETITQLFKEKIEEIQKKTTLGKTLMISIGLECTVVGARLSVLFPAFDFSYMPRKREVNDHNDIETDIGFSDYNTVIIIKDITFDAEEVVEIIEDQFSQKSIHLISLFYCGKDEEKKRILSGKENAHFYSLIDDIEIPRCDVPESGCPIINNKLQTIYRC